MLRDDLVRGSVCVVRHCHSNKKKGDLLFCPTCRNIWRRQMSRLGFGSWANYNRVNTLLKSGKLDEMLEVFRNRLVFYETVMKDNIQRMEG